MAISNGQANGEWELAALVHDLSSQLNARFRDRIARLGLTAAQATAIRELGRPMTLSELAGRMRSQLSNTGIIVSRLEGQALVERTPRDGGRARQVFLTAQGTELRKRLLKVMAEESLFPSLFPEERRELQELLQRATKGRYQLRR